MRKAAFALVVVALLAGCQKPEEKVSTTTEPGKKLKIVYIPKSNGSAYFDDVIKGFEEATKETGDTFFTTAPPESDASPTAQLAPLQEQIQQQADVIVVSARDPNSLNLALDDARKKGVLVLTVDADLTGNESHRDAAVLQATSKDIGAGQVELLGKMINYEGEFAILSATKDAPNQNAWIAVMNDVLKDPKYSKMKLVETVYGNDDAQKSVTEFEALIVKHPNLRGVIAPTSKGLPAAAGALERKGLFPGGPNAKGGGIVLTGLCTPNEMKSYVDKGVVQAFQLWSPHDMGYIATFLADELKSGKIKAETGTKFTAGKLGERTIGDKSIVIAGPLVTFDKSNIAQYNF